MNKIILVIGSVTAKQYEPIRLQLLREGHKVTVKRVSSDLWDKFPSETIALVDKVLSGTMSEEDASVAYKTSVPPECSFDFQEILEWFEDVDETTSTLRRAEKYVYAADALAQDVSGSFHFHSWDGNEYSVQTMAILVQGMRPRAQYRLKFGFEEATAKTNNDDLADGLNEEDELFTVPPVWHIFPDGSSYQI
jgi:hypothetical protein